MIKRKNKTVRRIAVSIIAAMIAVSPAYVCIPAIAAEEESADDKGEKKQEKDKNVDATEDAAEGGTQGSTEAASTEEPKDTGTEEQYYLCTIYVDLCSWLKGHKSPKICHKSFAVIDNILFMFHLC